MASYLTSCAVWFLVVTANTICCAPLPLTTEPGSALSTVEPEGSSVSHVKSTSQEIIRATADVEKKSISLLKPTSQESSQSTVNPTRGSQESSQSTVNPTRGSQESSQSTVNPTRGSQESSQSTVNPTRGSQESSQSTVNPTRGFQESSQSTVNPTRDSQESSQSTVNPTRDSQESSQSTVNPIRDSQESSQSTVNPTRGSVIPFRSTSRGLLQRQKRNTVSPFDLNPQRLSSAIRRTKVLQHHTYEQFLNYSRAVAAFVEPMGNIDTLCGHNDIHHQIVQDAKNCRNTQSVVLAILTVLDADLVSVRAMTASPIYHDITSPTIRNLLQIIANNIRAAVPEDRRSSIIAAISTVQPPVPNLSTTLKTLSCVHVQIERLLPILSSLQNCSSPHP